MAQGLHAQVVEQGSEVTGSPGAAAGAEPLQQQWREVAHAQAGAIANAGGTGGAASAHHPACAATHDCAEQSVLPASNRMALIGCQACRAAGCGACRWVGGGSASRCWGLCCLSRSP